MLLEGSSVLRTGADDLDTTALPEGNLHLHLHLDLDVLDPTPSGPGLGEVLAAVERVVGTGRVVTVGLAATWDHDHAATGAHRQLLHHVLQALQPQSAGTGGC